MAPSIARYNPPSRVLAQFNSDIHHSPDLTKSMLDHLPWMSPFMTKSSSSPFIPKHPPKHDYLLSEPTTPYSIPTITYPPPTPAPSYYSPSDPSSTSSSRSASPGYPGSNHNSASSQQTQQKRYPQSGFYEREKFFDPVLNNEYRESHGSRANQNRNIIFNPLPSQKSWEYNISDDEVSHSGASQDSFGHVQERSGSVGNGKRKRDLDEGA